MELETESEKNQTPVKTKLDFLDVQSKEKKNIMAKEAYNTIDGMLSGPSQQFQFEFEGKELTILIPILEEEEEDADVDDS